MGLQSFRFKTVVADPPWPYSNPGPKPPQLKLDGTLQLGCDVKKQYSTMTMEDIKALPVSSFLQTNAHLYLWTTNTFMEQAYSVARAWGFRPITIITWGKVYKDDEERPSMKMGYHYRSATEHVLFAVRGSLRLTGPAASTLFLHRRLPHSIKPDGFFQMVEEQSPGPYLELFARRERPGWDVWGNEVESTISLSPEQR